MPKLERWPKIPASIRVHLTERMRDRKISVEDLNQLRLWVKSSPEVPSGRWYKDFGTFKLCGEGKFSKTFLLSGQSADGQKL
jgi:hypothetical protein